MTAKSSNNRILLLFNGIIAILYGILALFVPGDTLLTIIKFFGIAIMVFGVVLLLGAVNKIRNRIPYFNDLTWAILILIIGGLLTFNTQRSLEIFVIIIGAWAILLGIAQLILLIQHNLSPNDKYMIILNGIITLIFGIILFFNPFASAKFLVVMTGIMAFVMGIFLIILAIKLKEVNASANEKDHN